MAVSNQYSMNNKVRVQIVTVDPASRRLEGMLKDGAVVQIATWEVGPAFVWPKLDEHWTIRRENAYWYLGARIEKLGDDHSVQDMQPGHAKIGADVVVDSTGRTFIAVDLTNIEDGHTLRWDAATKTFTTGP